MPENVAMSSPPGDEEGALRPGIASRHLPGAIQELVAVGDIAPNTAGIRELAAELPASWWMMSSELGQLDQQGWPMRYDVTLACRACESLPELAAPARAELDVVRAWLSGTLPNDALVVARHAVAPLQCAVKLAELKYSEDAALGTFAALFPAATDDHRRAFLSALRQPPAATPVWQALEAAYLARDGWLAYHAHRRLASPATVAAAGAIRAVVRTGDLEWAEVVAWARELTRPRGS
jgi:hypothetical protein